MKFNSNKFFKPTRDFNADDVIFSVLRQKEATHPYHNVSQGSYEYFNDVGFDKLIKEVKKVDDYHVQFVLSEPNAAFLADWGMDFASILSAEYADAMLKKGHRKTSITGRLVPGRTCSSSTSRIRKFAIWQIRITGTARCRQSI